MDLNTDVEALPPEQKSLVVGALWMVGISLLLFFVPVINGLLGGLIGGYKVGGVGRAIKAALLPALAIAFVLWLIFALASLPILGLFAGVTVGVIIIFSSLGLLLGAVIGGALAQNERRQQRGLPV